MGAQIHAQQPYQHQPLPQLKEHEPTAFGQHFASDEIDAEIQEVLQVQVADAECKVKTYNDYKTILIQYLFDYCNEFPNVNNPTIADELTIAHKMVQTQGPAK